MPFVIFTTLWLCHKVSRNSIICLSDLPLSVEDAGFPFLVDFAPYLAHKCPLVAPYFVQKCPLFFPLYHQLCPLWKCGQYVTGCHVLSLVVTCYHWVSCVSIGCYRCSRVFLCDHGLTWVWYVFLYEVKW